MRRHLVMLLAFAVVASASTARAQQTDRVYPTGLAFAPVAELLKIPLGNVPLTGVLPASIDLSGDFPAPGDQGHQGSCVGWAVAHAAKSYQERLERNWPWDENSLFSAAYVYNHAKASSNCNGGAYITTALEFVKSSGAAPSSVFPYTDLACDRLASLPERELARRYRIADYARVEPGDEFEMKAHLAGGRPVVVGMAVDRAFMNVGQSIYQGLAGPIEGGHALVVVGYDDARGAYKVINSWGRDWSFAGWGWVGYSVFASHRNIVREAYVLTDAYEVPTTIAPEPPPDAKPTGPARTLLVVYRRLVSLGVRSATRMTSDHHCAFNCAGEPTRTPYTLTLTATEGKQLRNPKLICEGEACPWTSISYLRLQDLGTTVEAGWSVWGRPTLWRLEAEEVELQDYRQEPRRAIPGGSIKVTTSATDAEPSIVVSVNNRQLRVGPNLNAASANIYFVGREEQGGVPTYTFRVERD